MYDPWTVAFEIRYPWRDEPSKLFPDGYRSSFVTIWHVDPERDGTDDSCGWFKRARHGDRTILGQIERRLDQEWDCDHGGLFDKDGTPRFSVAAIVLNLIRFAAFEHFKHDWDKTSAFMQRNLYQILMFAENPVDSLHGFVVQKYGEVSREYRIKEAASIAYGWVIRQDQRWWQHARWHFWHWRFQIHPWQDLKRRYWDRCCRCDKRGFPEGVSAIGNWSGDEIWHSTCEIPVSSSFEGEQ